MARLSGVGTDSLSASARRGGRLSAASVIGLGSILRDQKLICGSIYNTMSRSSNVLTTKIITSSASQTPLASSPNNNNIDPTYGNLNNMETRLDSADAHISNSNFKDEDNMWSNIDMIRSSSDYMRSSLSSTAIERKIFLNHNHGAGSLGLYSQGRGGHHDVGVLGFAPHEKNGCGSDYINSLHCNGYTYDHVMKNQSRVNNIDFESDARDYVMKHQGRANNIDFESDARDTSQNYFVQRGPTGSINNGALKNLMSESSSSLMSREYSDGGGPMPIISSAQKSSVMHDFLYVDHHSAPINVPNWSKILKGEVTASKHRKKRTNFVEEECDDNNGDVVDNGKDDDDDEDDNDCIEERIPPHELLARERACSEMITFSVCEGHGRTLKGRDMSRVRYAVWKQIGLAD